MISTQTVQRYDVSDRIYHIRTETTYRPDYSGYLTVATYFLPEAPWKVHYYALLHEHENRPEWFDEDAKASALRWFIPILKSIDRNRRKRG